MLIDTDVLIWVLRGNAKAAKAVDVAKARTISVVTYMELLQGARDKHEVKAIRAFLSDMRFRTLPLTENIGHRASIYMGGISLVRLDEHGRRPDRRHGSRIKRHPDHRQR